MEHAVYVLENKLADYKYDYAGLKTSLYDNDLVNILKKKIISIETAIKVLKEVK